MEDKKYVSVDLRDGIEVFMPVTKKRKKIGKRVFMVGSTFALAGDPKDLMVVLDDMKYMLLDSIK